MQQLNKIELRGNVGNVRIQTVGDNEVAHFSLATNYIYKGRDGNAVVETTWHNITAWNGKGMPDFNKIVKGAFVYASGRLRCQKFETEDHTEKQYYEVLANRVEVVSTEGQTQPAVEQ